MALDSYKISNQLSIYLRFIAHQERPYFMEVVVIDLSTLLANLNEGHES